MDDERLAEIKAALEMNQAELEVVQAELDLLRSTIDSRVEQEVKELVSGLVRANAKDLKEMREVQAAIRGLADQAMEAVKVGRADLQEHVRQMRHAGAVFQEVLDRLDDDEFKKDFRRELRDVLGEPPEDH